MTLFDTLDREKRIILRRINSIGEAIQRNIDRNTDLTKLENELKRLCDSVGIDMDDVLSIYL